jgi:hypothetical protein
MYRTRVLNYTLLSASLGNASAATLLYSVAEEGETLVVVPQVYIEPVRDGAAQRRPELRKIISGPTIGCRSESGTHPVRHTRTGGIQSNSQSTYATRLEIVPNTLLLSLDSMMDSGVAVGVCGAKYLGSLDLGVGICSFYHRALEQSSQRGLDS